MAADTTTLTEKMRAALRISSTSKKITEEINDCIAACKMDLQDVGVKKLEETDALIIRAITLYCKAEFGYSDKSEQFWKSYECLKMHLSLSSEYTGGVTPDTADDEVGDQRGSSGTYPTGRLKRNSYGRRQCDYRACV